MPEVEKMLKEAVVVYLRRGYGFENDIPVEREEVCLSRKTRKIGKDLLNGYGGGVEPGQKPEEAAIEELLQESSVAASTNHLRKIAILHVWNTNSQGETVYCRIHVYELRIWGGSPRETGSHEMASPEWFEVDSLPFKRMMLGDPSWLYLALKGELLEVELYYGPFQKELLREPIVKRVGSLN